MPAPSQSVLYKGSVLRYFKSGTGTTPLLLFHGFGQDHTVFDDWVEVLAHRYTLYSFDLYFHGASTWPTNTPLQKADWKSILELFFHQERISTFEIAGFSLGGKFTLATLESVPAQIKQITLVAPDGIHTSFWYSLATYPFVIRPLFQSMVSHPRRFYSLAKFLGKIGLADKGLLRFAESQMDTEAKRQRVYCAWVNFRPLRFKMATIASLLNVHHIPLTMISGKYDKVIRTEKMSALLKLVDQKHSHVLEAGHNDLLKKSVNVLFGHEGIWKT